MDPTLRRPPALHSIRRFQMSLVHVRTILTSTGPVTSTSVHKNFGVPHVAPQQKFTRRACHEVPTLGTRYLCGSLAVCFSSKAQEALCDQGCTRTGEPVLDFWYAPRGSPQTLLIPLLEIDRAEFETPLRTPVVPPGRRSWRSREEVPRGIWECRSLERSVWGTSLLSSNI